MREGLLTCPLLPPLSWGLTDGMILSVHVQGGVELTAGDV